MRREIAFHCRQLKHDPQSPIADTWTFDGNIFIKLKNQEQKIKITSIQKLCKFGLKQI
ncbi:hypothetical protein DPMN_114935 [Dreissena polymorpha]|uniref:Uncharacterized protein n=1 Tax=Dreissena polymorpha TaxID=45954 RepID=A0A9D4QS10_DREPO|nr:hypothetical protein DPMN_114935 [Dreissena polymorpha]